MNVDIWIRQMLPTDNECIMYDRDTFISNIEYRIKLYMFAYCF